MALIKQIPSPATGSIAEYWKLRSMEYSTDGDTVVTWCGYVDQDACEAGKDPVFTVAETIAAGTSPDLAAAVEGFAISQALSGDRFSGATVLE